MILLPGGQYAAGQNGLSHVYRLAIDARTSRVDSVTGRKYPSLLEGFTDSRTINGSQETSASTARGFYCFCLMPLTGPVSVPSV